jgi:hypothetical protein
VVTVLDTLDRSWPVLDALRKHLPGATHVLDARHVTVSGVKAVDEVRRRK